MKMAIKNLIKNKTDDLGKSNTLVCPVCNKETYLQLFSNYDAGGYVSKILGKDEELNFGICPLCSSVFKINMSSYGIKNDKLHDYNLSLINGKENE